MDDAKAPEATASDAHAHGPSLAGTLSVFGALMLLTGITVAVAYQDLGRWSALAALAVAALKGTLVVLYFMHVRYSSRLIALVAVSGFFFMAILLGITMAEVVARPADPAVDPLGLPRPAVAPARPAADEEPL
jgi:cytochrome c oxidase subunit IV